MWWGISGHVLVVEDATAPHGCRLIDGDTLKEYYKRCREHYASFTDRGLLREKKRLYKEIHLLEEDNNGTTYSCRQLNALKNEIKDRQAKGVFDASERHKQRKLVHC